MYRAAVTERPEGNRLIRESERRSTILHSAEVTWRRLYASEKTDQELLLLLLLSFYHRRILYAGYLYLDS